MATLILDFLRGYTLGERRPSVPAAYQWDQGHVLDVLIPTEVTTAEIHYFKSGMTEADVCTPDDITQEEDETYTITASVPDELLTTDNAIEVYVVVTDNDTRITKYHGRINVVGREMPSDYDDGNT